MPEVRGGRRECVPDQGGQGRREVPHRPVHPRARAARGPGRHRPCQSPPGSPWTPGPEIEQEPGDPIRIGYARCSTAQQDLDVQIAALRKARCRTIFSEKISSRVKQRPKFEKALALAHQIKNAAPHQPVIFTVHEYKRPARNSAELMTLASDLQAAGIQLELLTGPLTGIYDPRGAGSMLFAVLANSAQLDRDYTREKTLEGQHAGVGAEHGLRGGEGVLTAVPSGLGVVGVEGGAAEKAVPLEATERVVCR